MVPSRYRHIFGLGSWNAAHSLCQQNDPFYLRTAAVFSILNMARYCLHYMIWLTDLSFAILDSSRNCILRPRLVAPATSARGDVCNTGSANGPTSRNDARRRRRENASANGRKRYHSHFALLDQAGLTSSLECMVYDHSWVCDKQRDLGKHRSKLTRGFWWCF